MSNVSIEDRSRLEAIARVSLEDATIREMRITVEVHHYERTEVRPVERARLAALKRVRREANALGYEFAPVELTGAWDEPRKWDQYMLGLCANNVESAWRSAGGAGDPGWNMKDGEWGGPVTELILELYRQAGIEPRHQPSRSAIRDAMRNFDSLGRTDADTGGSKVRRQTD